MWTSCWMSGVFRRSNEWACRQNDWRLVRASIPHVIVPRPLHDRHQLLYTSPTTTLITSTRSDPQITAIQLVQRTSRNYKFCYSQLHQRNKPETAVATRPQVPAQTAQVRLCRRRSKRTTRLIVRTRPSVPFPSSLTQSALPVHL
jgi:hypothetical protein